MATKKTAADDALESNQAAMQDQQQETTHDPQQGSDPKTGEKEPAADDIVEIFVERDGTDGDPNLVVGVNGKNWVMPRGETSKVPRFVAEEYERSRKARYKADKTINQLRGIKEAH